MALAPPGLPPGPPSQPDCTAWRPPPAVESCRFTAGRQHGRLGSPPAAHLRVLPRDAGGAPGAVRRLVARAVLIAVIDAPAGPDAGRREGPLQAVHPGDV